MSINKDSLDHKGVSNSHSLVHHDSPDEDNREVEKLSKNQKRRKRRRTKIFNKIDSQSEKIQKLEDEIKNAKTSPDTTHASTQTATVVVIPEIEFEAEELQKKFDQDHIQSLLSEVVELKAKIAKISNSNQNTDSSK